jgi:tripartite-type tricarboxylate transporter receptor subunit TctC
MNRRELLQTGLHAASVLSAGAALGPVSGLVAPRPAAAQDWPSKQVRVIVPFGPGSATDLVPRTIFEPLAAQIGRAVVIENRPGGGTTVGAAAVAKADPDGHTMLVHSNGIVTVPAIQANVPYDPVKDFSGITPLGNIPLVLVVSAEKNITSLKQLVDAARAKPGSINYAAAGIGTPPHLTTERFRLAAGFEGQLVPFRSAPEAVTEVLTGRVDFYFCPLPAATGLLAEKKLVPLAVSSARRTKALPDVPTTLEAGYPNSDFDFWNGAFVPKATPREIVHKMHREIVKAIERPEVIEKLAKLGVEPMIMTPEDFDVRIAKETAIAVELTKAAKIKPQ